MRRFLIDNDGGNFFLGRMTCDVERSIAETVEEIPENVTTYLLCPGGGTYYYPTRVGEVNIADSVNYFNFGPLNAALKEGKDPFGMFLQALHNAGKETFITYRTNDVHNPDAEDQWNTPKVRKEHPDCIVDPKAAREKKDDSYWLAYCLDYSRADVREYHLAVISELVQRYGHIIDGFQLDWMRFPRHLPNAPGEEWGEVWEKRHFLTQFAEDVHRILADSRRKILLSARVPTNVHGCRFLGLDIAEWTCRKLVDFLVPSSFMTCDFVMPLEEMRAEMGEHAVPLYAELGVNHSKQSHVPESVRAAALSLFDCGADGIYMFNWPCWNESYAAPPYHWFTDFHDPKAAAKKPLLFSISNKLWPRVPNVDMPGYLPVRLAHGERLEVPWWIPKAAIPSRRSVVLVHSGGDIKFSFNGQEVPELPNRKFGLFAEHHSTTYQTDRNEFRMFQVPVSLLNPGMNALVLTNQANRALEIKRINMGLW